jgi:hypothetical protein
MARFGKNRVLVTILASPRRFSLSPVHFLGSHCAA